MTTLFRAIAYAIVLMLTAMLPAHAETFGRTTVGAQPSGYLSPDYKRVSRFPLTEPAVLRSVSVYLEGDDEEPDSRTQLCRSWSMQTTTGYRERKYFNPSHS